MEIAYLFVALSVLCGVASQCSQKTLGTQEQLRAALVAMKLEKFDDNTRLSEKLAGKPHTLTSVERAVSEARVRNGFLGGAVPKEDEEIAKELFKGADAVKSNL